MAAVERGGELVIDRGEGVYVWDEAGRRYLDATAGLWYCNVGYGREEIAAAAHVQLRRLSAYSTFGDLSNRPAIELCDRVSALAPVFPQIDEIFTIFPYCLSIMQGTTAWMQCRVPLR